MTLFQELWGVITNSHYATPTHVITFDFDITDDQKTTAIVQSAAGYGPTDWEQGEVYRLLGLRDSNPHDPPARREPSPASQPAGRRPAWQNMFTAEEN